VVVIVRVTGTVAVDEVKVNVAGLKLQLLFGGKPEHIEGVSWAEPVNPFCGASVRTDDPDCPGAAMSICIGFAAMVKACPTSTMMADDAEPE